jgi:hypothetical protein
MRNNMTYENLTGVLAHDAEIREAAILRMEAEYDLAFARAGFLPRSAESTARDAIDASTRYMDLLRENPYIFDVADTVTRLSSRSVSQMVASTGQIEFVGYATVFGHSYLVDDKDARGVHSEVIHKGAFTRALAHNPYMELVLGGHDGQVIAHTNDGTLSLLQDEIGLKWSAKVDATKANVAMIRHFDKCSMQLSSMDEFFDAAENTVHIQELGLDGLHIAMLDNPANELTSVGFTSEEADQKRLAKLDAELAAHGIF